MVTGKGEVGEIGGVGEDAVSPGEGRLHRRAPSLGSCEVLLLVVIFGLLLAAMVDKGGQLLLSPLLSGH